MIQDVRCNVGGDTMVLDHSTSLSFTSTNYHKVRSFISNLEALMLSDLLTYLPTGLTDILTDGRTYLFIVTAGRL